MADDELIKILENSAMDPRHDHLNDELEEKMCRNCGAVEGTPEYGTVGDGFDGLCPSCADAEEENNHEPGT